MEITAANLKYQRLLETVCPRALLRNATREDENEAIVVLQSLDHLEKKLTEVVYTELRAARFIPMVTDVEPGARSYSFLVMDKVGQAAVATGRGKNLPRVDAFFTSNTSAIGSYGAMYGYTTGELRGIALAAKRGVAIDLQGIRSRLCAETIARKVDKVCAFGDDNDTRIKGFLNNSNVTVESAAADWESLSPEELVDELFRLADTQFIVSDETFNATTILLPTLYHRLVAKRAMGLAANITVLEFFLNSMRAAKRPIDVESWPQLDLADAARTGPRAVAYVRDVDVAGSIIPLPFQSQPPQAKGLEWEVPCEGECGGVAVKQPLGMLYMDGLAG